MVLQLLYYLALLALRRFLNVLILVKDEMKILFPDYWETLWNLTF